MINKTPTTYHLGNDGDAIAERLQIQTRGGHAIVVDLSLGLYASQKGESQRALASASTTHWFGQR